MIQLDALLSHSIKLHPNFSCNGFGFESVQPTYCFADFSISTFAVYPKFV